MAIKLGVLAAMCGSFAVAWGGGFLFFILLDRPSIALVLSALLCLLAAAYARRRPVGTFWVRAPYALALFWALFALLWNISNLFMI